METVWLQVIVKCCIPFLCCYLPKNLIKVVESSLVLTDIQRMLVSFMSFRFVYLSYSNNLSASF